MICLSRGIDRSVLRRRRSPVGDGRFWLSLVTCCGASVLGGQAQAGAETRPRVFYVAPDGTGAGDGPGTAASFRDMAFWDRVQQAVTASPTVVTFLNGTYLVSADTGRQMPQLSLSNLGHPEHLLTITGAAKDGVVFTRHPDDSSTGKKGPGLFSISGSQNIVVRNLHFTAKQPIGYATHFGSCKNILIEGCSWIDLPGVYYGASGTSRASTDHVTFRNCVFKRVGSGGHAHMAYNAYDPKHIRFVDCYFEDCAGDYLRFRDGTEFGVVTGCTFKSTGTYLGVNRPFITVPLFNDDDPSTNPERPNYEYFGTHFLIFNNTFIYPTDKTKGTRAAFLFHHSGFDPPNRHHLLTAAEAQTLESGSVVERRELMRENLGIDANTVHFFGNTFSGCDYQAAYRAGASYGAKSRGWGGIIDITTTLNAEAVVNDPDAALKFFE